MSHDEEWHHMVPWLPGEKWADVPGYEGLYRVSTEGRVLSKARPGGNGGLRKFARLNKRHPYLLVGLSKDGMVKSFLVHRLVMAAFVGPCPEGMQVCHNDGNVSNPALSNLRYDTPVGNAADKIKHGTDYFRNLTHCTKGHEYTPENTYRAPGRPNTRYCIACRRAWVDAKRSARGDAA